MGDINAVKKGKVGKRVAKRVAGKATGRSLGKLFKWGIEVYLISQNTHLESHLVRPL